MRRVLAILGAVAMVVAAVAIRRQLDDDGPPDERADDKIVVVCADDLQEWCEALGDDVEVRIETAADTADALEAGEVDDDVDGWVTTSAWLEVTDTADDGPPTGELEVLASTPVAAASVTGPVGEAVEDLCRGQRTWDCLGQHAGEPWAAVGQDLGGRVTVGVTDADSALGLSVLASIGGGTFGNLDFVFNDFDDDFRSRISALKDGADEVPLNRMVTAAGTYAVASATAAAVRALPDGRVVPLELEPGVDATVVLVRIPGGDDLPSGDPVRRALVDDGWQAATGSSVTPTLKDGVMSALHQVWTEA